MGHKIFVSYKYKDDNVQSLRKEFLEEILCPTTVRTYVDLLESYFDNSNHIYKGESDDEDLSQLNDDTIWEKLKPRIFDSTVTIVMISPGMREIGKRDRSQWIPWEVSFSLRETTRNDRTSHTNAMLALVLPDRDGSYSYFVRKCSKCDIGCLLLYTDKLFSILKSNMFNLKEKKTLPCPDGMRNFDSEPSYIKTVLWNDFKQNPNSYIEQALEIKNNAHLYRIPKEV